MQINFDKMRGEWALITGASQGIGYEFCEQLASYGMNVFMIAREESLLQEIQTKLQTKFNITVHYCAIDLTTNNAASVVFQTVHAHNIRISLLCNNVACGKMGEFVKFEMHEYRDLVTLNVVTAVALAHAFFEDLKSAPSGILINVSSQAALQPVPYMAVYGASKAFLHSWSLALSEEWLRHGIYVQTVVPAPTQTNFDMRAGSYSNQIMRRALPREIVSRSLLMIHTKQRIATNVPFLRAQQIFGLFFPISTVLKRIGTLFKPPTFE